ncbi:MAG: arginine repressor [Eubacteriales bacterium]|nr:arginine repressor [Eubacteriales bacterium]
MKNKRHECILEIIHEMEISTQEELQKELKRRGFEVTQATVSRDIRRLRLVKQQTDNGKNVYAAAAGREDLEKGRLLRLLKDSVRSVDFAQNILVIRTDAGMAMGSAAAIDGLSINGIIGCIAGDDTIMAVFRNTEEAEDACRRLGQELHLS